MKKLIPLIFAVSLPVFAADTDQSVVSDDDWVRGCTGNSATCYFSANNKDSVVYRWTTADAAPGRSVRSGHVLGTEPSSRQSPWTGYHWVRAVRGNAIVVISE